MRAFMIAVGGMLAMSMLNASARRRCCVLRLYRLRRGDDHCAGSEESKTRHADRHSRIAGDLHCPLSGGRPSADRDRLVRPAQRRRSDARRSGPDGSRYEAQPWRTGTQPAPGAFTICAMQAAKESGSGRGRGPEPR